MNCCLSFQHSLDSPPSHILSMVVCVFKASLKAFTPSKSMLFSIIQRKQYCSPTSSDMFLCHYPYGANKGNPLVCSLLAFHLMPSRRPNQFCCLFIGDWVKTIHFSIHFIIHPRNRFRCHNVGLTFNASAIAFAPSSPMSLSAQQRYVKSFRSLVTFSFQTPQIEVRECCVHFESLANFFRSLITKTVVYLLQFVTIITSHINTLFQTIKSNCCERCVGLE